jgi:hypothetical protein
LPHALKQKYASQDHEQPSDSAQFRILRFADESTRKRKNVKFTARAISGRRFA